VKAILGLERRGQTISINPCIPTVWTEFTLDWTIGSTRYHFVIENPLHWSRGVASAELDGVPVEPEAIPLTGKAGQSLAVPRRRRPDHPTRWSCSGLSSRDQSRTGFRFSQSLVKMRPVRSSWPMRSFA
jgi:hypothetical protein